MKAGDGAVDKNESLQADFPITANPSVKAGVAVVVLRLTKTRGLDADLPMAATQCGEKASGADTGDV